MKGLQVEAKEEKRDIIAILQKRSTMIPQTKKFVALYYGDYNKFVLRRLGFSWRKYRKTI